MYGERFFCFFVSGHETSAHFAETRESILWRSIPFCETRVSQVFGVSELLSFRDKENIGIKVLSEFTTRFGDKEEEANSREAKACIRQQAERRSERDQREV